MRVLVVSDVLCERLAAEARATAPRECCGLIEGVVTPDGWRAEALHGSDNLAADPERGFLVDPQVQFDALRALRGTARAIIGCYHSHPGGWTEPSACDREEAADDAFVWLIVAGDALAAYVFDARARDFAPLTLRRCA
jgi:proteasome lid subunit RPN8/RPN11